MKLCLSSLAAPGLLLAMLHGATAGSITVVSDSPDVALQEVRLERLGEPPISVGQIEGNFSVEVPPPEPAAIEQKTYMIIARWKDISNTIQSTQFYLRPHDGALPTLTVYTTHLVQTERALASLAKEGLGFDLELKRFQLARGLYRAIDDPNSALARKALDLWFRSAYALARDYAFMAEDREVIEAAKASQVASLRIMATQYELLPWRAASGIQAAYSSGQYAEALVLNNHFTAALNALPDEKKALVTKYYGINQTWLANNAGAISVKLASGSSLPSM